MVSSITQRIRKKMLKESIDYIKILIKFKLKIANWRKTIMEDRLKRNLY